VTTTSTDAAFRVHLTNIAGAGAVQLVSSLLPELEQVDGRRVTQMYLPDRGPLAAYRRRSAGPAPIACRRVLPNALSRLLECMAPGRYDGAAPLLVLGDLPLRVRGRQAVFVHQLHLVRGDRSGTRFGGLKYHIARAIFRWNAGRAQAFVVQTATMKDALLDTYPMLEGRLHVVPQPPPAWLLAAGLRRTGRRTAGQAPLSLFYPAAPYPHKNHALLARADPQAAWPVERLALTVPPDANPAPQLRWIHCVGALAPDAMLAAYRDADALLFLSNAESYGLPLVEAMWVGLPIVCPDLPYARSLCGDEALYFRADDPHALHAAVNALHARLAGGWWPDWSGRLDAIPDSWNAVANAMVDILFDKAAAP
jgi:glycosyltransferase involved in cell wall biosynthesis